MINFEDKTIIVTGAASGIGKATAELINGLGGRCLLLDINAEALAQNNPSPEKNIVVAVDLTDFAEVNRVISQARNEIDSTQGGM